MTARLIAVLGYSETGHEGLHSVCAARLARAQEEARPDDVVLLSGWARHSAAGAEADLMARAWNARVQRLFVDRGAHTTVANAIGAARVARTVGASEVLLVTSGWHGRRAAVLLRAALRGTGASLRLVPSAEPPPTRARLRELACWSLTPVLALAAGWAR